MRPRMLCARTALSWRPDNRAISVSQRLLTLRIIAACSDLRSVLVIQAGTSAGANSSLYGTSLMRFRSSLERLHPRVCEVRAHFRGSLETLSPDCLQRAAHTPI